MSRARLAIGLVALLLIAIVGGATLRRGERSFERVGQPPLPKGLLELPSGERLFLELADDEQERARGLSYRWALAPDGGMAFLFPEASPQFFWMKDMRFSLDILFFRDQKVVGVFSHVPPPKNGESPVTVGLPDEAIDLVIELPAGAAQTLGITTGTIISPITPLR